MGRRSSTIIGASVLVVGSAVPFLLRFDDPFEGSGLGSLLLEIRGLDAALTSDALQLRLGMRANGDLLAGRTKEIGRLADEFDARCDELDERSADSLRQAFAPFLVALADRRRALEAFPVDNARLNDSLQLLGATYESARAQVEQTDGLHSDSLQQLEHIHSQTLHYYLHPDEVCLGSLLETLQDPRALAGFEGAVPAMLGHARILASEKASVDEQVRSLVETSGEQSLLRTFAVFEEEARAAARRAEDLRALVYGAGILAVVVTCSIGTMAALRQSAALEREVRERTRVDQESRKLESELRQSQKLESLGQLAAGIAHEINTPVQFVNDSVHFVRDAMSEVEGLLKEYQGLQVSVASGTATPETAEAVALAAKGADLEYLLENVPKALQRSLEGLDRVASIVRSLKDFAHPGHCDMVPADLNQAIQSTLTVARGEYKYVAELETDFALLPPVTCHIGSLNQAVLNILVNAAHAIGDEIEGTEARGRIVVRTRVEGDSALVSISDTGGGIPEEIRERIFDPFFTTKPVGKGTGQGLAISHAVVVEKHGGSLTLETEAGKGTTFFIRIPFAGRPSAQLAELEAAA